MLLSSSETMRDKSHGQEENSPERQLRSLIYAKWLRRLNYSDSQEVSLEAATLERVRNSSLVKWFSAENIAGLSVIPNLRDWSLLQSVGERSVVGWS